MNADAQPLTADKPCLPPRSEEQRWGLVAKLLPAVSRSFYLTLRVLPKSLQRPIGLAYLLARAADTIADTRVVSRERRLAMLLLLRRQLEKGLTPAEIAEIQRDLAPHQSLPEEKTLVEKLDDCFLVFSHLPAGDRARVAEVVITLTRGMEFDLTRFPGESADQLAALTTADELDQYTYYVAGCVGPFWTKMCAAHVKELGHWDVGAMGDLGIRFGKGLQLCNVLRDIPKDLRIGRCYLPSMELETAGLKPRDLLNPGAHEKLRPLYDKHLDLALAHLAAGWRYTMSVPASRTRLRLACAWPILIGLKTVAALRHNHDILNPDCRIKISRNEVYRILARTFLIARFDGALNLYCERLVQEASH